MSVETINYDVDRIKAELRDVESLTQRSAAELEAQLDEARVSFGQHALLGFSYNMVRVPSSIPEEARDEYAWPVELDQTPLF